MPKKTRAFDLRLEPTEDIAAALGVMKGSRVLVGFAMEDYDAHAKAERKLARKGCDLIVANDVSGADSGFDVDTNTVSFVWPDGSAESLPPLPKHEVASRLLDRVRDLLGART